MVFTRHPANPILTREDVHGPSPLWEDVSSVFNPGAIRDSDGTVHLILRVQNRGRETALFHAVSTDGVQFEVTQQPLHLTGHEDIQQQIHHLYDPRLTRIGDTVYMMLAADLDDGCRLALASTTDWHRWEFHGLVSEDDNRNGVLFPERMAGEYVRLERPNRPVTEGNPTSGEEIHLTTSPILYPWTSTASERTMLLDGRLRRWDERIGAGPPPLKTRHGWLLIYHGIATHFAASNIYQAGAVLLDLDDPRIVLARSRLNLLEPRELYELTGQVPNVVFPSGMVAWDIDAAGFASDDSPLYLYYGAADTCIGLAESTLQQVIDALEPVTLA